MAIYFDVINEKKVGYRLRANELGEPFFLQNLVFKDFIPPYLQNAKTSRQVYNNLEQALNSAINQQDSVLDGKRAVMIDVLANATLQREAMRNAMKLIQDHYL